MKIYIAARFTEKGKVKSFFKTLENKGHSIAYNWTNHKNAQPFIENSDLAAKYSENDVNSVLDADVLIVLTDEIEYSKGLYVELGAALAKAKITGKPKIYVVGKNKDSAMFFFHPFVKRRKNIDEVLKEL
ncbi:MAG: hypothetical protein EPN86_03210 [Nanoarchaeota archaeon]|nr:MAG: hypothetical protein EPN86_03210 [Nanoarchaeota archaeon]